jgi:hypothetical protein
MKEEKKVVQVEAVPQRIDQPTQDGARSTLTETLEIVHSPIQNMTVVMDSEQPTCPVCRPLLSHSI